MTNIPGKVWIILGLLAVVAGVALVTIKHFALSPKNVSIPNIVSRIENEGYIVGNCYMLSKFTNQYFSAHPTLNKAPLYELVGPGKYIDVIAPVAGERYPSEVTRDGDITVVLRDGASFVFNPNTGKKTYLPAAQ
jgi:hypothetical protein